MSHSQHRRQRHRHRQRQRQAREVESSNGVQHRGYIRYFTFPRMVVRIICIYIYLEYTLRTKPGSNKTSRSSNNEITIQLHYHTQ